MTMFAVSILDRAGETVGEGLPGIGAAVVLLVFGILVARLVGALLGRGLRAAGLDDFAERSGVHDLLERLSFQRSLSRVAGKGVRLALIVVVLLAALSLLGLAPLQDAINEGVVFLPRVLVALVLLLAGAVVGSFAKGRADRLAGQMDLPGPIGRIAELAVFAIFSVTALALIGVPTEVLSLLVAIVLAGAVGGFALAFGLGGRDAARAMTAGRVVRGTYEPGQTISVAGVRGEIVAVESAATVVRTNLGMTVRIPNHVIVESVVELHDGLGQAPQ